MSYIHTATLAEGGPDLKAVHAYMHEVGGLGVTANIMRMFSLRPASMRRMIRTWELGMWMGEEPRATRELVAAMVSRINQCVY